MANLIKASPFEITFTSGATESTNMVLKGLAKKYGNERKHIITTQIEHHCTFVTCNELAEQGFKVTFLPVGKTGILDIDTLRKAIEESEERPLCVSVIFVHN